MYQSIVVCLDGSSFGENALPVALTLARRAKASLRLILVHVPLSSGYTEPMFGMESALDLPLKERGKAYLQSVVERVQKAGPVCASWAMPEGPVADMVLAEAAAGKADLVVLTTHGRGPIGRFWLGSVADELVRRLPVPTLLVRPQGAAVELAREVQLRHLLIPLDGSPLAERALTPATELGAVMNADYTLMRVVKEALPSEIDYVQTPQLPEAMKLLEKLKGLQAEQLTSATTYLESIAKPLRERGLQVQTKAIAGRHPAVALLDAVAPYSIDLLALATHGRRGLPRLVLGSVADKIIRGTSLPVLVYRPEK